MQYVLIAFLVIIILILIFREFWCWYLKINQKITEQKKSIELIEALIINKNKKK
jgi:hypothetical protein